MHLIIKFYQPIIESSTTSDNTHLVVGVIVGSIAVAIIILLIMIIVLLLWRNMKLKKQLKNRVNISAYVKDYT